MPETPAISAIVCTLDRGPEIERTIHSLLTQDLSRPRYEVLIIDNGSNPENAAILHRLAAEAPDSVRVIEEPIKGLGRARNRGIETATGDIVAFIDDDAIAARGWLRHLCTAFEEPDVAVAGGRVCLLFEGGPKPEFIDTRLTPYLSAFDPGDQAMDLPAMEAPRGCNIAFRKSVFEQVGPFDEGFGRIGKRLRSLEEIDVAQRIEHAGHRIRYVPDAAVQHIVRTERLEPGWFRRRIRWQGRSLVAFDRQHFGFFRVLSRLPGQLGRCLVRRGVHRWLHLGYVEAALGELLRPRRAQRQP